MVTLKTLLVIYYWVAKSSNTTKYIESQPPAPKFLISSAQIPGLFPVQMGVPFSLVAMPMIYIVYVNVM